MEMRNAKCDSKNVIMKNTKANGTNTSPDKKFNFKERPTFYPCIECGQKFTFRALKIHKKTCTEKSDCSCSVCKICRGEKRGKQQNSNDPIVLKNKSNAQILKLEKISSQPCETNNKHIVLIQEKEKFSKVDRLGKNYIPLSSIKKRYIIFEKQLMTSHKNGLTDIILRNLKKLGQKATTVENDEKKHFEVKNQEQNCARNCLDESLTHKEKSSVFSANKNEEKSKIPCFEIQSHLMSTCDVWCNVNDSTGIKCQKRNTDINISGNTLQSFPDAKSMCKDTDSIISNSTFKKYEILSESQTSNVIGSTSVNTDKMHISENEYFETSTPLKCGLTCSVCSTVISREAFGSHVIQHSETDKCLQCPKCNKIYFQKSKFLVHFRKHTANVPFFCRDCKSIFQQYRGLKLHTANIHGFTEHQPYHCYICFRRFSHASNIVCHMRLHSKEMPFKCSECSRSFSQIGTLQRHLSAHRGERPHKCTECDKSFTAIGNLKSHMRIHTGETPFVCSVCNKAFTQLGNMKIHMARHLKPSFNYKQAKKKREHCETNQEKL